MKLLDVWHMLPEENLYLGEVMLDSFLDNQLVADAISLFQEQGASGTFDFTLCHDGNPVAENISLVHVVSCQNYNLVLFVLL